MAARQTSPATSRRWALAPACWPSWAMMKPGHGSPRLLTRRGHRTAHSPDDGARHDRQAARDRPASSRWCAIDFDSQPEERGARLQHLDQLSSAAAGLRPRRAVRLRQGRAGPHRADDRAGARQAASRSSWIRRGTTTRATPAPRSSRRIGPNCAKSWVDGRTKQDLEQRAQELRDDSRLDALLLTRSEEGMTLFTDEGAWSVPAQAREVFDVSGAGDTVIAVLAVMLAAGARLRDAVTARTARAASSSANSEPRPCRTKNCSSRQ